MGKIKAICTILLLLITTGAEAGSLCFDEAGAQYGINPQILRAIAKVESNFNPRAINWNTNGTYDFGVMQINTIWGYSLGKEWWSTLGDPCTNIRAGAMILASCMKKYGYTWEAIGCYNSQTPEKRDKYAMKVFKQLQCIEREENNSLKTSNNGLKAADRNQTEGLTTASVMEQGETQFDKSTSYVPASQGGMRDPQTPPAEGQPSLLTE